MRQPGRWLRTAAARVCAKQTMERVIDPIVADVQTEYHEAMRARHLWRATWVCARGYFAFWKAAGLHTLLSGPRARGNGIATDAWALGRTMGYFLVAFVSLTLLLAGVPMVEFYSRVPHGLKPTLLLLPQAIPLSIPMALPLAIVCSVHRDTRLGARRIRDALSLALVATLLAFAAMAIVPYANQAFRVALARELGLRGVTKYSLPKGPNELSLSELSTGSKAYDAGGIPEKAREFRRVYHIRFALPAATFVLSLLALGVGGMVRRRAWRVVAIVVALALYWAAFAFAGRTTSLPPAVSVWASNIVFTAMALGLLKILPGPASAALCD